MPLYEYECEQCGHRFEQIQKFSDPPVETCPSCGGPVRKLISSPAFQFKGTGWYITDYARKDQQAASSDGAKDKGEPKAESGKTDTAGEGKGDSKTETKTETKTEKKAAKETASSPPAPAKTE